jgi:AcrR family transcriptional regulator
MQRLLARTGPEVSVDEVCAVAGCSKGAFYYHFPAKRDLILRATAEMTSSSALEFAALVRLLPSARRDAALAAAVRGQPDKGYPKRESALEFAMNIGGTVGPAHNWPRAARSP